MSNPNSYREATFKPSMNHWRMPLGLYREHVTRGQLRALLLKHPSPLVQGRMCEWKTKHLGAGVYELCVEEKK